MFLPPSAFRKMGIFPSVVWRMPFMVWFLFKGLQTNTASGSVSGHHLKSYKLQLSRRKTKHSQKQEPVPKARDLRRAVGAVAIANRDIHNLEL